MSKLLNTLLSKKAHAVRNGSDYTSIPTTVARQIQEAFRPGAPHPLENNPMYQTVKGHVDQAKKDLTAGFRDIFGTSGSPNGSQLGTPISNRLKAPLPTPTTPSAAPKAYPADHMRSAVDTFSTIPSVLPTPAAATASPTYPANHLQRAADTFSTIPSVLNSPTAADYKKFMGSYDPNSRVDRQKADAINKLWTKNNGRITASQLHTDPGYMGVKSAATAFASLGVEKQAKGGAELALREAKNLVKATTGSRAIVPRPSMSPAVDYRGSVYVYPKAAPAKPSEASVRHAAKAERATSRVNARKPKDGLTPITTDEVPTNALMLTDRQAPANERISKLMEWLKTPQAKYTGIGTGAGVGGLAIGNSVGRGSGLADGRSQGYDKGVDYGIQATLNNLPEDGGFLGRLMSVFTGSPQAPKAQDIQQLLAANKDKILEQLRGA